MVRISRSALAVCLFSLAGTVAAQAGDVKVYDRVPSVEELGAVLGGTPPTGQKKVKFRKLEFGEETSPAQAAPEPTSASPSAAMAPSVDAVSFPINFGYASPQMLPDSRPYADVVGKLMAQRPDLSFVVEGHTDAAGSDGYNLDLSQRRAAEVRSYIVGRYGIDPARLQPVGLGEAAPLPGEDPYSPRNRRVQFRPAG